MKVDGAEGTIEVTKTLLGHTTNKTEKIVIRPFVTDTAHVGIKYTFRAPYGAFGIDVSISSPCYKEEMSDVYKQVKKMASDIMAQELEEYKTNNA